MHHAVGVLRAVELRAAPLHAGVRGAFAEIGAVDARHALDVVEREDQRLVDEAVDHQPVVGRIDLGDAGVVALEAQSVRRDDAVDLVQRREADRALRRGGEPRHVAAGDVLFVFRALAVRPRARRLRRASWSSRRRSAADWLDLILPRRRGRGPTSAAAPPARPARKTARREADLGLSLLFIGFLPWPVIYAQICICSGRIFSYPAFSGSQHADVARFARRDDSLLLDVAHDHVPDRRTFGAFIHAGPAGDDVVLARIERLAGLERREVRDAAARRSGRHRSCRTGRRRGPCRRPADSRGRG